MRDDELAEVLLRELRAARNATGVADLLELGKARGVEERYQIHRVAERLRELGLVEELNFSGESLLARLTEAGEAALEGGDLQALADYSPRPPLSGEA